MSLEFIPNQPVIFEDILEDFSLPYDLTDTISLQYKRGICNNGDSVVCNGDFGVLGDELITNGEGDDLTGWTYTGSEWVTALSVVDGQPVFKQTSSHDLSQVGLPFVVGKYYRLVFEVKTGSIGVVVGGLGSRGVAGAGISEFYLPAYISGNSESLILSASSGTEIKNISIYEVCWLFENLDGSFWDTNNEGGYFSNITGELCKPLRDSGTSFTASRGKVSQSALAATNTLYEVSIVIEGYAGGSLTLSVGDSDQSGISGNGTFVFSLSNNGNQVLSIESTIDFVGCVKSISVYSADSGTTDVVIEILDSNNNFVNRITTDDIVTNGVFVEATFNWVDYVEESGCYRIAIYDPCNNESANVLSNFTDESGSEGGFSEDLGNVCIDYIALGGDEGIFYFTYDVSNMVVGEAYRLLFNVTDLNNVELHFEFAGLSSAIITTVGVGFIEFTATSTSLSLLKVYIETLSTEEYSFCINSLAAEKIFTIDDYSGVSNQFKLLDANNGQGCPDLLVKYRCNNSAFGFDFSDPNFFFYLRLSANIRKPKYPDNSEVFDYSSGVRAIPYYNVRKIKVLCVSFYPEFIHDCLSLIKGCDVVFIEDVQYVFEKGEYRPEANEKDTSGLMAGQLELSVVKQNLFKKNCSEPLPVGNYLLDPANGNYVKSPE